MAVRQASFTWAIRAAKPAALASKAGTKRDTASSPCFCIHRQSTPCPPVFHRRARKLARHSSSRGSSESVNGAAQRWLVYVSYLGKNWKAPREHGFLAHHQARTGTIAMTLSFSKAK